MAKIFKFLFIGGAGLLVLCAGLFSVLIKNAPKRTEEQIASDKLDAQAIKCRRLLIELVQPKLKTPTEAKFDLEPKKVGRWMIFIDGTVTSRNSFNAPITSKLQGVWGREKEDEEFEFWGLLFDDLNNLNQAKIDAAMTKVKAESRAKK